MTGQKLKALRRRTGLTQAALAELVGVAPNSIARFERDELVMKPTTARLIEFVTRDLLAKRTTVKTVKTTKRPTRKVTKRTK